MWASVRKYFVSGLVVFLPLSLTIYLFVLMLNMSDNFLGKFIEPYFSREFGFYFRGISILICLLFIVLIGFLATNFLGKKVYTKVERLLLRLPFFKQVYPPIKEMAIFLFSRERAAFKQVVLVEYPRKGIYAMGFLTNDSPKKICQKTGNEMANIFIPSAPGPLTGYIVMVPKNDYTVLDISVEDAIKFMVSGGVVNPL